LSDIPGGFPWPILVAQHMPAAFTASLARRLDGLCALRVIEVTRPTPLAPGCIYIARGDADMTVSRRPAGPVALSTPSEPRASLASQRRPAGRQRRRLPAARAAVGRADDRHGQ
jgi:chemotaxis response regulator CheB